MIRKENLFKRSYASTVVGESNPFIHTIRSYPITTKIRCLPRKSLANVRKYVKTQRQKLTLS